MPSQERSAKESILDPCLLGENAFQTGNDCAVSQTFKLEASIHLCMYSAVSANQCSADGGQRTRLLLLKLQRLVWLSTMLDKSPCVACIAQMCIVLAGLYRLMIIIKIADSMRNCTFGCSPSKWRYLTFETFSNLVGIKWLVFFQRWKSDFVWCLL